MATYDERFRRESRLFDGTEILIRSVRPEDAPLLRAGFAHLSPRTRYLRFFAHKAELTTAEASRFASVREGEFAVGALGAPGSPIAGMGMGVARFSELDGSDLGPGREAEAAVVVVDAFQGRGVGRQLLVHLAGAARERGIHRLRFTALIENAAIAALLRRVFIDGPPRGVRGEGPVTHWIVELRPEEGAAELASGGTRASREV